MRRINKKGATHVEMIISFAIFISFIIFILLIFSPLKIFSRNPTSLEISKARILEEVSTNLSVFSLTINLSAYDISANCFEADFNSSLIHGQLIMRDESENLINATIGTDKLYFENSGIFYRIYFSEELEERVQDTTNCEFLSDENYTLGVERIYKKVSLTKLTQFFEDYKNYEQFRDGLGLKNNFNVFILNSSRGVIDGFKAEISKPEAVEVIAAEFPIEILDENLTLTPSIMNIQVW